MLSKKQIEKLIELFGNQKTKLVFWILNNLNNESQLIMTQRQIAKQTNISVQTVNKVIQAMIDNDILIKINNSAYKLNTEIKK